MTTCKGCRAAIATRYVPNNPTIVLCASCNELLWGLRTRPLNERSKPRCICGCGNFVIHKGDIGVLCRHDIYEWLYALGGGNLSLLNDNPFVYRISKSHIEFAATLGLKEPGSGPDWIRWWKRGEGWKVISFKGIQSSSKDSA